MSSFLFFVFFSLWCVRILSNFSFTNFSLQKLKYPKSVAFIICNEFCERFNFYGMRSKYFWAVSSIALFRSFWQSSMWPIIICVFKHFSSFINFSLSLTSKIAVLVLYLTGKLAYSNDDATVLFHVFTSLAYFFPLIGAIIADSWLGRFRYVPI